MFKSPTVMAIPRVAKKMNFSPKRSIPLKIFGIAHFEPNQNIKVHKNKVWRAI